MGKQDSDDVEHASTTIAMHLLELLAHAHAGADKAHGDMEEGIALEGEGARGKGGKGG